MSRFPTTINSRVSCVGVPFRKASFSCSADVVEMQMDLAQKRIQVVAGEMSHHEQLLVPRLTGAKVVR